MPDIKLKHKGIECSLDIEDPNKKRKFDEFIRVRHNMRELRVDDITKAINYAGLKDEVTNAYENAVYKRKMRSAFTVLVGAGLTYVALRANLPDLADTVTICLLAGCTAGKGLGQYISAVTAQRSYDKTLR